MTKEEVLFQTGRAAAVYATALGRAEPGVKFPFSSGPWFNAARQALRTPKKTATILNEQFDFFVSVGYISASETSFYESVFEEIFTPFFFLPEFIYPGAEREIAEAGWNLQIDVMKERLEEVRKDVGVN